MNRIESKSKAGSNMKAGGFRRAYIVILGMAFAALFAMKSEFTADVPDMPSDVELKETATTIVVKNDDDDYDDDYDYDDDDDDDDDDGQLSLTWEEAILKNMTQIKQTQIENYRKGSALMLNIHATHHGGTSFCGRIGRNGLNHSIAPTFACMGDRDHKFPDPEERGCSGDEFCKSFKGMNGNNKMPWTKEQTGPYVEAIRPYFHMISWEFSRPPMGRNHHIDDPDWDYPNLLSVIITRDPLSRLLAADRHLGDTYPGFKTGELNRTRWWDFAAYDNEKKSDNFFLRIVASKPKSSRDKVPNHLSQGIERTTDEMMELFPTGIGKDDFNRAKDLLDKMTIVLDIACLTEGMEALGNLLGLDLPDLKPNPKHLTKRATPRERIGYEDVYEYLEAKHEWDIALYEYSKTISLLKCDDL